MTNEEIYNAWAPPEGRWSRWAKPVLFAHLAGSLNPYIMPSDGSPDPVTASLDLGPIPRADGDTALVIDTPAATGAMLALRLAAERGYCPVPLYNAVPVPFNSTAAALGTTNIAIDLADVMDALRGGAQRLPTLGLSPDAPPAFVLDARRRGAGWTPHPGAFDNRSVSLPTDFPSATFLLSHGIRRAILIQPPGLGQPQPDLSHTLRRWQEATIEILIHELDGPHAPRPIDVAKPSWFGHVWHHFLVRTGLRRNPLGGFGGYLPVPSSSHGAFG